MAAKKTKENSNNRKGREETREQLLEAAMDLFAQRGYRGASVRDLAAAAGVTTGAFYSNFGSKREIYIAVIDKIAGAIQDIVDRMTRDAIEVMRKKGSGLDYELLRRPIMTLLEESRRHAALLHILRREGLGTDPDFQREMDRVWERFVDVTKKALDLYIEAGMARPYDTELFARSMVPMFIAMSIYYGKADGAGKGDIVSLISSILHGGASKWVVWREHEKRKNREDTAGK